MKLDKLKHAVKAHKCWAWRINQSHISCLRRHRNQSKGGREMILMRSRYCSFWFSKTFFLCVNCDEDNIYIEHKNRTSAILRLDFFPQLTLKRRTAILQKNIFLRVIVKHMIFFFIIKLRLFVVVCMRFNKNFLSFSLFLMIKH